MTLSISSPRAGRRWLLLAAMIAICTLGVSALALATHGGAANPIPSNYTGFVVLDQQLANDVPGQVDLTQMGRDDATLETYKVFWSWDSISSWTGTGQTGDACALFDTDADTNINFVVCVRVQNFNADPTDVRILADGALPAYAFTCSDKKDDRCTNPVPTLFTADQIQAGALGTVPLAQAGNLITHTDPFAAGESYNHDSTVEVWILKALFSGTEVLVNVCSYPSAGAGGNNNPFDCIVSPGGGFLQIVKDAGTGVTSPNFTFDVHRSTTLLAQKTIAGSGTAALIPILVDPNTGPNVVVTETNIDSAWQLTTAGCTLPGTPPVATGTFDTTNNRVTGVSIQSGAVTTCTFTDRPRTGTLTLTKTVENDDGGTAVAKDFTLSATGSSRSFSLAAGSSATSPTGSTGAQTVTAGVQYTLSENTVAGYTASAWTCSGTGTTQGTGDNVNKVTIALGGSGTCAITNRDNTPTLTLTKTVENDDGGTAVAKDFTLSATGTSRSFSLAAGSSATSLTGSTGAQTVTAGVQYTLSENTVAGYTASAWTCSGTGTTQGTGDNVNKVTIALGGSGTCAITNRDNTPTLTLTKTVENDDGGTAVAKDFTLSATGTSRSFSLAAGSSATSLTGSTGAQTVTAGVQYTLSENTVAGYTASAWTCSGTGTTQGTGDNVNKVTIALGGSGTCAITNRDNTPTLTLTKTVENDDGGTAVAKDFTLSATGTSRSFSLAAGSSATSLTGSTGAQTVTAGVQYTLSENTVAGYTASAWTCSGTGTTQGTGDNVNKVTIALGGSGTCAITNRDNTPTLTLTKTVENDDGGTAVAKDFTLSATGTSRSFSLAAGSSATSLTGSTGAQTVTAGVQYTLSENTVAGYTASAWTCSGTGTTQGTGDNVNKVTIALGGSGTCAITNRDNTPTLTLTKTVENDDGGTAVAKDFTLSATGTSRSFSLAAGSSATSLTGSTGAQTVTAGVQYTLSENTVAGYTASAWTCSGTGTTQGTGDNVNKVTIALGGSGTCAITNRDSKASPAGTTVQRWVLHDSLTITGIRLNAPDSATADVIFRLYGNSACTGTPIGTETDSTIAAGVAATSTGVPVTATGFYYWTAQYSGDQFNNGFTTTCGAEVTQIQAKDAFGGGRDNLIEPI